MPLHVRESLLPPSYPDLSQAVYYNQIGLFCHELRDGGPDDRVGLPDQLLDTDPVSPEKQVRGKGPFYLCGTFSPTVLPLHQIR